jgi:hypothetical protein
VPNYNLLGSGAFADVFDIGDGTVIKAYRRQRHAPAAASDGWIDHDRITRLLWRTEAESYERLQPHHDVNTFVPIYHGRVDPVALGLPQDLEKGPHVPGCGIRLEKLRGEESKIAHLPSLLIARAEIVLERIGEICGRINLWDASCIRPGPRTEFAVIDFSHSDDYGEVCEILERRGCLPESTCAILRLDQS